MVLDGESRNPPSTAIHDHPAQPRAVPTTAARPEHAAALLFGHGGTCYRPDEAGKGGPRTAREKAAGAFVARCHVSAPTPALPGKNKDLTLGEVFRACAAPIVFTYIVPICSNETEVPLSSEVREGMKLDEEASITPAAATLSGVAEHLGLSRTAARDLEIQGVIDRTAGLGACRLAYIRHLRSRRPSGGAPQERILAAKAEAIEVRGRGGRDDRGAGGGKRQRRVPVYRRSVATLDSRPWTAAIKCSSQRASAVAFSVS
jgi:hypothetical protein